MGGGGAIIGLGGGGHLRKARENGLRVPRAAKRKDFASKK